MTNNSTVHFCFPLIFSTSRSPPCKWHHFKCYREEIKDGWCFKVWTVLSHVFPPKWHWGHKATQRYKQQNLFCDFSRNPLRPYPYNFLMTTWRVYWTIYHLKDFALTSSASFFPPCNCEALLLPWQPRTFFLVLKNLSMVTEVFMLCCSSNYGAV